MYFPSHRVFRGCCGYLLRELLLQKLTSWQQPRVLPVKARGEQISKESHSDLFDCSLADEHVGMRRRRNAGWLKPLSELFILCVCVWWWSEQLGDTTMKMNPRDGPQSTWRIYLNVHLLRISEHKVKCVDINGLNCPQCAAPCSTDRTFTLRCIDCFFLQFGLPRWGYSLPSDRNTELITASRVKSTRYMLAQFMRNASLNRRVFKYY